MRNHANRFDPAEITNQCVRRIPGKASVPGTQSHGSEWNHGGGMDGRSLAIRALDTRPEPVAQPADTVTPAQTEQRPPLALRPPSASVPGHAMPQTPCQDCRMTSSWSSEIPAQPPRSSVADRRALCRADAEFCNSEIDSFVRVLALELRKRGSAELFCNSAAFDYEETNRRVMR